MSRFLGMPHNFALHVQEQPLFHSAFCSGLFESHWHTIYPLPISSEVLTNGSLYLHPLDRDL